MSPKQEVLGSSGGLFSLAGRMVAKADLTLIFSDGFESGDTIPWSATIPDLEPVPAGAVMFFNDAACPSGWSPLVDARGRTVVGVPTGGTLGGLFWSPMSNLSDQVHRHLVTTYLATGSAGSHQHWWAYLFSSEQRWISYQINNSQQPLITWGNGIGNEGSGVYPFTAHLGEDREFRTNYEGSHAHGLYLDDWTGVTSGIVPYLQLLACEKD